MYNSSITSVWSTPNQTITESKIIKAKNPSELIERVNDYVDGRPAKYGEIKEIGKLFTMIVEIYAISYNYTVEYPQPYEWTITSNTGKIV